MNVSCRDEILARCTWSADALQSVVEKFKLFPAPVRLASPVTAERVAVPSVSGLIRHCVVLGMTIIYYHEKTAKLSELQIGKKDVMKAVVSSIEKLRVLTNRFLSDLTLLAAQQITRPEKYAKQFSKIVDKLQKQTDHCASRLDLIVDLAHLPTIPKTMFYIKQMPLSDKDFRPELLEFSELFPKLVDFTIRLARTNAEIALTDGSKNHPDNVVAPDTSSRLKMVMERRNAHIEDLLSCTRKLNETRITKAEEYGFISRTQATRREPKWKNSESPNSSIVVASSPTTIEPKTSSSQEVREVKIAEEEKEAGSNWPLEDGTKHIMSGTKPPPFDLDEVYDSYHDHDIDATLGLPGTNAVQALKRQPSHKARPAPCASHREKFLPPGAVLAPRRRLHIGLDSRPRLQACPEAMIVPLQDNAPYVRDPVCGPPYVDTKSQAQASSKLAPVVVQDVRDQYY